jgi:signal transduction histidine kinase
VEWDFPAPLPGAQSLPCDELLIILGNIIRNAFEATDGSQPVRAHLEAHGDGVIFRVSDCGEGMSAAVLQRLGEPFFSTKKQGTGLGFFLAKCLTEKCGGTLNVQSTEGKGTTITVEIPWSETFTFPNRE